MRTYLILFVVSALASLWLTPIVRRRAVGWGAVAVPDGGRHIHARPTPRLGGIAIYFGFLLSLGIIPLMGNLLSEIFAANLWRIAAIVAPATLIFAFGIYDDFRPTSAPTKLLFQSVAALMMYASGYRIEKISSPFGGYIELPGLLALPLTAFWIILVTNAFNLIDGIDGLAAGASILALLSIVVFSIAQGNPEISVLSIALIGALIGFLRYNFNPATIFLGDSGSLFLGFMAAALSLAGSQKGTTIVAISIPMVSFGLPLTEAALSLARRFLSGAPLLAGDRGHIHHRLLDRGLTQRQAAMILYAVCGLFSLFGLMLLNPQRSIGALVFFILGVGLFFGVQHLRYPEFREIGEQIRHRVRRRRRAIAANVRLRRTSADLTSACTPEEFISALAHLEDLHEFDRVMIELEESSPLFERQIIEDRASREPGDSRPIIRIRENDPSANGTGIDNEHFWSLRVPLVTDDGRALGAIHFHRDTRSGAPAINLARLCNTLPRQISRALARLVVSRTAVGR